MTEEFVAKVKENKQLTKDVFETSLKLDKPMIWQAGQYISVEVGIFRRSYSICSLPTDPPDLSICVDTKPNGPGSKLIKGLKIGDVINFKGPYGEFTISNYQFPNYIFVATGTGIGPFKAMIPTLLNNFNKPIFNVQLFWGLRHKSENYYVDFWQDLANKFSNFKFQIVYSEDGYHVTEYVKDLNGEFYLCGNEEMIKDILKFRPEAHFESYYPGVDSSSQ